MWSFLCNKISQVSIWGRNLFECNFLVFVQKYFLSLLQDFCKLWEILSQLNRLKFLLNHLEIWCTFQLNMWFFFFKACRDIIKLCHRQFWSGSPFSRAASFIRVFHKQLNFNLPKMQNIDNHFLHFTSKVQICWLRF